MRNLHVTLELMMGDRLDDVIYYQLCHDHLCHWNHRTERCGNYKGGQCTLDCSPSEVQAHAGILSRLALNCALRENRKQTVTHFFAKCDFAHSNTS